MKHIAVVLSIVAIFTCDIAAGQNHITINKKKSPVQKILASIEKQTDYTFWYQDNLLQDAPAITLNVRKATIDTTLALLIANQAFTYELADKVIVLKKKPLVNLASYKGGEFVMGDNSNEKTGSANNGYQQMDSKQSTASFGQMKDKDIQARQGQGNIMETLSSSIPGVSFQRDAKGNMGMVIRGATSFEGSAAPLIVLDGFPFEGDINSINVNNIDNVTVLKDAAAASIWGTRGGNGVIVITTKKGEFVKEPPAPPVTILRKDGRIYFNKAHLAMVMKHIADNYKIEIKYEGKVPEAYYVGNLSGDISANEMLHLLLAGGVNLHREKNLVTVSGLTY